MDPQGECQYANYKSFLLDKVTSLQSNFKIIALTFLLATIM